MSNEDFKVNIETEITSATIIQSREETNKKKERNSPMDDNDVILVMNETPKTIVNGNGNGNGNYDEQKKENVNDYDNGNSDKQLQQPQSQQQEIQKHENDKKYKRDVKYRRTVIRAFGDAQNILDKVRDGQGLDIYQYCAFLSKHAYHVAPKTKNLKNKDKEHDEDEEGDDDEDNHDAEEEENNDEFQMNGHVRNRSTLHSTDLLRKAVNRKYRVTKPMYYVGMAKALLVAGLQLLSLLVAMTELIRDYYNQNGESFCNDRFEFQSLHQTIKKTLFAGFCALIAINVTSLIKDLGKSGMYATLFRNECLVPDLIDQGWLIAGRTVNYLVLISSTWASFLIIFFSRNVLDMVINSVAIFFVLQLDNMVIGKEHYKIVENYLNVYEWDIEKRVDAHIRKKNNQITEEEKNTEKREWNIIKLLFDFIAWILSTAVVAPAVFLTSFLAFIFVPAFILVCAQ